MTIGCTVPHAGGMRFPQANEAENVAIMPVEDSEFDGTGNPERMHIQIPKSRYSSFLKTIFDETTATDMIAGTNLLKMEDLINKQFLVMAFSLERLVEGNGITALQNNKKIHKLLGTSDPDVISRFYSTAVKPISHALAREGIVSMDDIKKMKLNEVDDLLGNLEGSDNLIVNYRDRFDGLQSMLGLIINGKETIARQIAENSHFIALNKEFLDDYSEFGIHSINAYSPATKQKLLEKHSTAPLKSPNSLSNGSVDAIILAYLVAFDIIAFAAAKPLNTGTDFIGKFDMSHEKIKGIIENVKEKVPELNKDELDFIGKFLEGEKCKRRILVYEMKSINLNKESHYGAYRKFFSHGNGQMLDSASSFIARATEDYKTLISQANDIMGSKYFDSSSIRQFLNFPQFFSRAPSYKQKREMINSFLKCKNKAVALLHDQLAGNKLKEAIASLSPDRRETLANKIAEFMDVHMYLVDVATVEEFLFSNRVMVLDLENIGNGNVVLEVPSTKIPVIFENKYGTILLKNKQEILRNVNGETVFGFDLFDERGTTVRIQDNPFMFGQQHLLNILKSKKLRNILLDMKNKLRTNPSRFFEPKHGYAEEINRINKFLETIDTIGPDHYLKPFNTEMPQTVTNFLKQKLQARLFGNDKYGIISQMTRMPFQTTKGIIASGDKKFLVALQRIIEFRYLKTTCYTDLVISYRKELPFFGKSTKTTKQKNKLQYNVAQSMDDFAKAQLMYQNMRIRPSISRLIPKKSSQGILFNPIELQKALDKHQFEKFIDMIHNLKFNIRQGAAYKYRQPSQIIEVKIQPLKLKNLEINGTFLDLSRPLPSPTKPKTTISETFAIWAKNAFPKSASAEKWNAALETLKNIYNPNSIEYAQNYNEMVYFADRKAMIGTFLIPIFQILDEHSKNKIRKIALQHAKYVENLLKTQNDKRKWPANTTFAGTRGGIGKSWNFPIKSGNELPNDFHFIINDNNAILWYLDAIAHQPSKSTKLNITHDEKNILMLKFITLTPNQGTTFKLDNIAIATNKNRYTKDQEKIIAENQEAIIRYFAILDKNARTLNLNAINNAKNALENHLSISFDNHQTQKLNELKHVNNKLFQHMAANVIPPNLIKIPNGNEIPFQITVYANRIDFLPLITDKKTLQIFMQIHNFNPKARKIYQNTRKTVEEFFANIDKRTEQAFSQIQNTINNTSLFNRK